MVARETILKVINNILSSKKEFQISEKCRPSIDEITFSKLKTNEEIANFFGLKFLSKGRPDVDNSGPNKQIAFYDKRNHVMITFKTDENYKIGGLDFSNNHVDGNYDDGYVANLKDVIRAYYESPYIFKKATWLINFQKGDGSFVGGDCHMYGINMYNPSLWGDVKETMYHEMSHALAFQSIDWKNGETINVGALPNSIKPLWEKATQQDYKYQKKNNLMHQDTSEYGSENQSEDFAEMGTVISSKLTKSNYRPNSSYIVREVDETSASGYKRHRQTVDEIIESNPNRAKLMTELIKNTQKVNTNNKRDYINSIIKDFSEQFDEEYVETW